MSNLISSQEASKRLGISIWTLYRWSKKGKLSHIRLGKKILFDPQDLEKFISDCRRSTSQNR